MVLVNYLWKWNMEHRKLLSLVLTSAYLIGGCAVAAEDNNRHSISRYTSISTTPELRQSNPLLTVVSFSFPPTVTTVGQAVTYTIEQTGYTLVDAERLPEQAKIMLALQLPSIQRKFSYVTVQSALRALAGDAFVLLVDPIRRQISYAPILDAGVGGGGEEDVVSDDADTN
jgi:conjugative transfer region protein (TIGR03748 family)